MDITYLGEAAFLIKGDRTVAVNTPASTPANIHLWSTRQNKRKVIVDGPGEYEIGGVLIATAEAGKDALPTLAHAVQLDGLNVVHLGDRVAPLDPRQVELLGPVDVLILNADDLTAAQQAVAELTPRVVLPFGAHAAELATGLRKDTRPETRFSWPKTGTPPRAVLLKPARRPKPAPSRKRAA